MDRQQALRMVASKAASLIGSSTTEEATGVDNLDTLSDADIERLEWAMDEVQRRLYRMGGRRG